VLDQGLYREEVLQEDADARAQKIRGVPTFSVTVEPGDKKEFFDDCKPPEYWIELLTRLAKLE
jgi:predicted DsbA family dithiol-disulfide isomerase